jgi:hypothetical protein
MEKNNVKSVNPTALKGTAKENKMNKKNYTYRVLSENITNLSLELKDATDIAYQRALINAIVVLSNGLKEALTLNEGGDQEVFDRLDYKVVRRTPTGMTDGETMVPADLAKKLWK